MRVKWPYCYSFGYTGDIIGHFRDHLIYGRVLCTAAVPPGVTLAIKRNNLVIPALARHQALVTSSVRCKHGAPTATVLPGYSGYSIISILLSVCRVSVCHYIGFLSPAIIYEASITLSNYNTTQHTGNGTLGLCSIHNFSFNGSVYLHNNFAFIFTFTQFFAEV